MRLKERKKMQLLAQIALLLRILSPPRLPLQIFIILFYVFLGIPKFQDCWHAPRFPKSKKNNWNYPWNCHSPALEGNQNKSAFCSWRGTKYGAGKLPLTIAPLILTVVVGKEHVKLGLESQQSGTNSSKDAGWSFVTLRINLILGAQRVENYNTRYRIRVPTHSISTYIPHYFERLFDIEIHRWGWYCGFYVDEWIKLWVRPKVICMG